MEHPRLGTFPHMDRRDSARVFNPIRRRRRIGCRPLRTFSVNASRYIAVQDIPRIQTSSLRSLRPVSHLSSSSSSTLPTNQDRRTRFPGKESPLRKMRRTADQPTPRNPRRDASTVPPTSLHVPFAARNHVLPIMGDISPRRRHHHSKCPAQRTLIPRRKPKPTSVVPTPEGEDAMNMKGTTALHPSDGNQLARPHSMSASHTSAILRRSADASSCTMLAERMICFTNRGE